MLFTCRIFILRNCDDSVGRLIELCFGHEYKEIMFIRS